MTLGIQEHRDYFTGQVLTFLTTQPTALVTNQKYHIHGVDMLTEDQTEIVSYFFVLLLLGTQSDLQKIHSLQDPQKGRTVRLTTQSLMKTEVT